MRPASGCNSTRSDDLRAQRTAQQRLEIRDDLARVDHRRFERLATRERQKLLDQVRAALARVTRRFDLLEHLRPVAKLLRDEVEVADEHGQQIVEVVRDAGGEAPERLHSRAVLHRRVQLCFFAHIYEHAARGAVRHLAHVASQRDDRAARGPQPEHGTRVDGALHHPTRPLVRLGQKLGEWTAAQPLGGADFEELPHANIGARDAAVRRQHDRRDDRTAL